MRSDVSADDGNCALFEARLRTSCDQQPWRRSACRAVAGIASESWWSQTGSNRRPHACKARALPAELWPRNQKTNAHSMSVVGLGRLELPTSRLSSARSNQLSYKPLTHIQSRTRDSARLQPQRVFVREERETKTAKSRQCSSTILTTVGH